MSLIAKFFEDRNIDDLMQRMFVHIKTQIESTWMPESGLKLSQVMHLLINIDQLALTRGSSSIELTEWIVKKKE